MKDLETAKERIAELLKESEDVIVFGSKTKVGIVGTKEEIIRTIGVILNNLRKAGIEKETVQHIVDLVYQEEDQSTKELKKMLKEFLGGLLDD